MAAVAFSLVKQVAGGAACGIGDFLVSVTYQKVCMLAGVKFEEIEDAEDVPPHERLDKQFWDIVVKYPIGEEVFFRGLLQPFLAKVLLLCMPQLATPVFWGIPRAKVVAAVAVGTGFGIIHYFIFKSGGAQVAILCSISGSFYGIVKERFGLVFPISAHMIHNFMIGWLDKHYPAFTAQ
jgi:membrane protease YdiL (CAAX protease family)